MRFKYTDYHVHTNWSHDIAEFGPEFEDYLAIAERNRINICFLDHYELYQIENDKNYPFYGGKIVNYLEEVDKIKETYDFVLSGLEVDYYPDREDELRNFKDDYGKQFDFLAGTLHETEHGLPVTTRKKLMKLLNKKRIKQVVVEFFHLSKQMIQSKIFENICHLDTIFRYINRKDVQPTFDLEVSEKRVLELGRLCISNDIRIEYNLSGLRYPIKRPFPAKKVIKELRREGAKFFVGSDSHSINYFRTNVKKVKKAYKYLKRVKEVLKAKEAIQEKNEN
jgi:HisJ family histidinol phosphate phosphatase